MGGSRSGVTTNPLQMAQAYSTFANNGVMNDAHLITKIENASGQVVKLINPLDPECSTAQQQKK